MPIHIHKATDDDCQRATKHTLSMTQDSQTKKYADNERTSQRQHALHGNRKLHLICPKQVTREIVTAHTNENCGIRCRYTERWWMGMINIKTQHGSLKNSWTSARLGFRFG